MKPSSSSRKYVFRRPMWRILMPLVLVIVVWLMPTLWQRVLSRVVIPEKFNVYLDLAMQWCTQRGLSTWHLYVAGLVISFVLLYFFITGMQSLVLTQDGLYRSYGLWHTRTLPWDDVLEIRIDRVIRRLEDHRSTSRCLVLKFKPELRWLPPPTIKIDNFNYPEYPFAEAVAVRTGVSHKARRLYRDTMETGIPATFAPVGVLHGTFGLLIYLCCAVALCALAGQSQWWQHAVLAHVPTVLYLGAIAMIGFAIDAFFYKQLGCDGRDLLIMRRGFIRQRVPIAAIDMHNIDVHINSLKIFARLRKGKKSVCVYSGKHYLRNRAVLLCMLRSVYEFLRNRHVEQLKHGDTQKLKNTVNLLPEFRGEDEQGNVEVAEGGRTMALKLSSIGAELDRVRSQDEAAEAEFAAADVPDAEVIAAYDVAQESAVIAKQCEDAEAVEVVEVESEPVLAEEVIAVEEVPVTEVVPESKSKNLYDADPDDGTLSKRYK